MSDRDKRLYEGFRDSLPSSRGPIPIDETDAPENGEAPVYDAASNKFIYGAAGSSSGGSGGTSGSIKAGVTAVQGGATTGFLYKDTNGLVNVSDSPLIGPLRSVTYSDDAGTTGMFRTDGAYLYICIGPNEWRRVLLDTFAINPGGGGGGPLTFGPLGLNLSPTTYYSSALPMVDFWRTCRDWPFTYPTDGSAWDSFQLETVGLNEEGEPTTVIPFSAAGKTHGLTYGAFPTGYPGQYTIDYDGTGQLAFINAPGTVTHPTANRYQFTAATGDYDNQVFVRITNSSVAPNNVRNIRVTAPCASDDGVWNNDFITQISGLGIVRAMENLRINTDEATSAWTHRREIGGGAGDYAALAQMGIRLQLPKMWVCIPMRADDDYVAHVATAMQVYLNAVEGSECLFEYGNEAWNGIFPITGYLQTVGQTNGLQHIGDFAEPASGWEYWTGIKQYARRCGEIWGIIRSQINDGATNGQAQMVIGGQADFPFLTSKIIEFFKDSAINPDGADANYIGIAPYMGGDSPTWTGLSTVAQVHTKLMQSITEDVIPNMIDNQAVADANGMTLACYEAGAHLYNNPSLGTLFVNAARDPGIQGVYESYIDAIRANSAEDTIIVFFAATQQAQTSDGSAWGVYEVQSSNPATAYKLIAIKNKQPVESP